MKIEYNNLYIHYILITQNRYPFIIHDDSRARVEKYITGIINNTASKLYAIYANPDHIHFLVSRTPKISDEALITKVAEGSVSFINENKLCEDNFSW